MGYRVSKKLIESIKNPPNPDEEKKETANVNEEKPAKEQNSPVLKDPEFTPIIAEEANEETKQGEQPQEEENNKDENAVVLSHLMK